LGFESVCLIDLDLLLTGATTSWVDVESLATVSLSLPALLLLPYPF
jgi:hypothetical protein